jgi:hypothetical protein
MACLAGKMAAIMQFGRIRHSIPIQQRFPTDPNQAADISGKPIVIRPVMADGWAVAGPCPVKQAYHPVIKYIEKAGQGMVIMIQFAVADIIRDVQGHGALGAQQPHEFDKKAVFHCLIPVFKTV